MADGATKAETLAAVEVAAMEWIATARELDRPIPKPRGRLRFASRERRSRPWLKENPGPHAANILIATASMRG